MLVSVLNDLSINLRVIDSSLVFLILLVGQQYYLHLYCAIYKPRSYMHEP